jgi:hypothetical protein
VAWFGLALPVGFLFYHTIVNRSGDVGSLLGDPHLLAILVVALGLLAASVVFWLYFKIRQPTEAA